MQTTFLNDASKCNGWSRRFLNAEHLKAVRGLFHVVQYVVELGCELVNVLAVEWSDETSVQCIDNPANDIVAGLLLHAQFVGASLQTVKLGVEKLARGTANDARGFVKQ